MGYKGIYAPRIVPKLDLTADAEYIDNLVMSLCGCKRASVQFIRAYMCMLYLQNDIFLTDIIGYDRLKFS